MRYLFVFAAALAVRLAIVASISDMPVFRMPALDSRQYLVWAGWILDGRFSWPQPTVQGPLYPMLLAGLLAITGSSLTWVASLQAIIGACSAVLTMSIARRWFDARVALATGLLQALYAPLALAEVSILVEGFFVLLVSAFVLVFTTRRESARGLFAAGALAGLAAICRATALPVAAMFALFAMYEQTDWRARLRRAGVFVLGVALFALPVATKNALEGGGWNLQGRGGFNFWIGNAPEGDGLARLRTGKGWDEIDSAAARAGIEAAADQDRYYLRMTLGEILDAPGAWLRVIANKAAWSTQQEEVRDSLSFHFYAAAAPWLRWLPGFGVIFALAAAGATATVRAGRMPRELAVWTIATWATLILLVVGYRYRLPLVPPLVVLAGAGVIAAIDAIRAHAWRAAGVLAAAALAAGLVSQARVHAPSHVFAEELAFTGHALLAERRMTDAEARYREAIAADPEHALAWLGLGSRFYNVGEFDKARDAYTRATEIDPYFADAWLRLAWIEGRTGRTRDAVHYARRAAAIFPFDPEIRRYLARYLFDAGDYADAATELEWLVARAPDDAEMEALLTLARRRLSSSN